MCLGVSLPQDVHAKCGCVQLQHEEKRRVRLKKADTSRVLCVWSCLGLVRGGSPPLGTVKAKGQRAEDVQA